MRTWMPFSMLLMPLLAGCGGDPGYKLAPVSGKVLWKGKPLAKGHVSFAPTGSLNPGPASYGKTDADGNFKLKVETNDRDGAVVGEHIVRISTLGGEQSVQSDSSVQLPKDEIPPQYNTETTLKFTVPPEGTKQADFDLKP